VIDWQAIETGIGRAVSTCVRDVTDDVTWDYEPPRFRSPVRVSLKRTPIGVLGIDAGGYEFVGGKLREHRLGQRTFSVEVRAETHQGRGDGPPVSADDLLAWVVTRIRRRSIAADLVEAGCALTGASGITRQTYSVDGTRDTRAAILTLSFITADVDAVPSGANGEDFIETVEGEVNGDPFTAPP
jgi:hypothetical protein